jgi:hypothetical protein
LRTASSLRSFEIVTDLLAYLFVIAIGEFIAAVSRRVGFSLTKLTVRRFCCN